MNKTYKSIMKKNPWVQCPTITQVEDLIRLVKITNYTRGANKAQKRLDHLEATYREWISPIADLSEFKHCYFVNGVTDAINQWIATEDRPWQYLEGDYEYANIISGRGEKVKYTTTSDVLYVSNPACATGNFINLGNKPNPVILDCAYLGSTAIQSMHIPTTTEQIWFSFSKGWGLIGQRAGLVFTKKPHKSLEPMKRVEAWNYTSVEVAIAVIEHFGLDDIYNLYRPKQLEICEEYNLTPSDCFFIANSTDEEYAVRRRKDNIARLDLSYIMNAS
tara:strand:- start:1437 stop:2264 length:828 start_codon:yes stop_codon:yes gene_type:complete